MYSTNSLHPSCNSSTAPEASAPAPTPAAPVALGEAMEVDQDSLELEEITLAEGRDDHLLVGEGANNRQRGEGANGGGEGGR